MLNAHPPARLPIRTKRRLSEEGRRTRPKPGKEKNRWYVDLATAYFYPGLLGTWIKMDKMLMMLSWMTISNGEQSLMQNQDQTLNLISGTLNTLHGQASLMGREVYDQNGFVLPPPSTILVSLAIIKFPPIASASLLLRVCHWHSPD
jgi:hypothetical protein